MTRGAGGEGFEGRPVRTACNSYSIIDIYEETYSIGFKTYSIGFNFRVQNVLNMARAGGGGADR